MYSKKEVCELIKEYGDGLIRYNQFLKEKGLIEPELEVGWLARDWGDGDLDVFLCTEIKEDVFVQAEDCFFRNNEIILDGGTRLIKTSRRFKTRKATDKEVEDALIAEAKRRGYKKGLRIKCLCMGNEEIPLGSVFNFDGHYFYLDGTQIFQNGKWAEIVETKKMTVEEVEKALGYNVEIIS